MASVRRCPRRSAMEIWGAKLWLVFFGGGALPRYCVVAGLLLAGYGGSCGLCGRKEVGSLSSLPRRQSSSPARVDPWPRVLGACPQPMCVRRRLQLVRRGELLLRLFPKPLRDGAPFRLGCGGGRIRCSSPAGGVSCFRRSRGPETCLHFLFFYGDFVPVRVFVLFLTS